MVHLKSKIKKVDQISLDNGDCLLFCRTEHNCQPSGFGRVGAGQTDDFVNLPSMELIESQEADIPSCTVNISDCEANPSLQHDDTTTLTSTEMTNDEVPESGDLLSLLSGEPLSVRDVTIVIQAYVSRHKLSNAAANGLLMILNRLFSVPLPKDIRQLQDGILSDKIQTVTSFYCNTCLCKTTQTSSNEKCLQIGCTGHTSCAFTYVPVENMIALKFQDSEFVGNLLNKEENNQEISESNYITCVFDCHRYKSLSSTNDFGDSKYNLTWRISIDGVPISNSSNVSAWPIFLTVNELPAHLKRRHALLAGVWVGNKKPNISSIMEPVCEIFNGLFKEGIMVTLPDGSRVRSRSALFSFHADLPARAQVLNMNQYNGKFSCAHCVSEGETFKTSGGGSVRIFRGTEFEQRTMQMVKEAADSAILSGKDIEGIKGPSVLLSVQHFDIVNATSIDYMHQVLLGIIRSFLKLWFNSTSHKEVYYCGKQSDEFDRRIAMIKPPDFIHRTPRSIATLKHWKASEYRTFLLFYMIPCLQGILPSVYLEHSALLATGVYHLSKEVISPEDILLSQDCFKDFVSLVPTLYSPKLMTLNVHALLHLGDITKSLGSLADNSNFDFEDLMGEVKDCVHGTQYYHKQIVNKILVRHYLPQLSYSLSPQAQEVYHSVTNTSRITAKRVRCNGFDLLGNPIEYNCKNPLLFESLESDLQFFSRMYVGKMLLCSRVYTRQKKRINYCVEYEADCDSGQLQFGLIDCFVFDKHMCCAILTKLLITPQSLLSGNIIKNRFTYLTNVSETREEILLSVSKIKSKCLLIDIGDSFCVCKPPNMAEWS